MTKSKTILQIEGSLEINCAIRLENQLCALQDFIMMAQHDIIAHLHLSDEDYDKMLKMENKEIEQNKKPELNALNQLMYAMSDLGNARDELTKIIGVEKEIDKEINKSYR